MNSFKDVNDDIRGAMRIGMKAVQVKTGKYLPDVVATPAPTKIVENFAAAVDWIVQYKRKCDSRNYQKK